MATPEVIIIDEGVLGSVIKDIVSVAALLLVVGVGIVLESQALQWVGALIWMVWVLVRASRHPRLSVTQARQVLDQIERGRHT